MSNLPPRLILGCEEEASRLWQGALEALERAPDDLVALCEALDLGIRAAEILAFERLRTVREEFPGTIALRLEQPALEVEAWRDAVSIPRAIQFTDILDLLSADGLECVSPRLHRGWEDRRFSCQRARQTAHHAVDTHIATRARSQLLLLSAYRNRLFRYPPPLALEPPQILEAFPSLSQLVQALRGEGS